MRTRISVTCGLATLTVIASLTLRPTARAADEAPAVQAKAAGGTPAAGGVAPAAESPDGVRSINLAQQPIDLPDAPGKQVVVANCILCHSTNYITMQPAFPRKVWEAEVEKMRKTFGAPVPEQAVPQIVDYLMAIRGEGSPATRPVK